MVDAPSCNEHPASQQQGDADCERSSSHRQCPVSEEGGDARVEVVHAVESWVCIENQAGILIWDGKDGRSNRSGEHCTFSEVLEVSDKKKDRNDDLRLRRLTFLELLEVSDKKKDRNDDLRLRLTDGRGWLLQREWTPFSLKITHNGDAEAGFKYCPLSGCISEVGTDGVATPAGIKTDHVGRFVTHVDGRQLVSKFIVSSVLCQSIEEGLHYPSEKRLGGAT